MFWQGKHEVSQGYSRIRKNGGSLTFFEMPF
jgi:hypothetical protein